MIHKRISALLAGLLLLSMFPTFALASEPVVIKLMTIAGNGGHTTLVERFNATHDNIKIELDNSSSSWEKLGANLVKMSEADAAPDIATVSTSFYPQLASQGLLMDIADYVEGNINKDEYYWSAIEGLYHDGKLLGLPISMYTLMCYYNRDLFEAAGVQSPSLDWGNTWTMDEWAAAAEKLTSGEGQDRTYGAWIEYQLERTACLLFPKGLDYWDEDIYPQFDNQEIRDIHEKLYAMVHADKVMPDSTVSVSKLFDQGKLGTYITGTWSHLQIAESPTNFGVLPTPGGRTVSYVDVYVPMASTKHPEETKEVMLWLISEEAATIKYNEYTWGLQVHRGATEKNRDIMLGGLTNEEKQCVLDSLENSQPLTVFDKWAEFLTDSVVPISKKMSTGEYTVNEGFDLLQEEALYLTGHYVRTFVPAR